MSRVIPVPIATQPLKPVEVNILCDITTKLNNEGLPCMAVSWEAGGVTQCFRHVQFLCLDAETKEHYVLELSRSTNMNPICTSATTACKVNHLADSLLFNHHENGEIFLERPMYISSVIVKERSLERTGDGERITKDECNLSKLEEFFPAPSDALEKLFSIMDSVDNRSVPNASEAEQSDFWSLLQSSPVVHCSWLSRTKSAQK